MLGRSLRTGRIVDGTRRLAPDYHGRAVTTSRAENNREGEFSASIVLNLVLIDMASDQV